MGALLAAAFIVGFQPTLLSLHARWASWTESYSHGYLLLLTAIYLYFDSEHTAPRWLPDIRNISLLALATISLGWLVFSLAGITILQQLLLPAAVLSVLGSLLDKDRFWRALLPVGLIFLGIPIWDDVLTPSLQLASVSVSAWAVKHIFDIPTVMDGFHISIPAGTFEVASGCAGLVFLLSAITLGIVYGQLFLHRGRARVIAVVAAAMLGILVNWARIIILIAIGQATDMKHSLVTEGHLLFGWYLFSGVMAVAIFLSSRFQPWQPHHHQIAAKAALPLISTRRFIGALCALLVGPLAIGVLHKQSQLHADRIAAPPLQIGSTLMQIPAELRGFIEPKFNVSYRYAANSMLTISLVYYPDSFGKGKLLSQSNQWWPADTNIVEQQTIAMEESLPDRLQTITTTGRTTHLAWSFFRIGNMTAATSGKAKLLQLEEAFKGQLGGAYLRFEIPCSENRCVAEQQILAHQAPAIYADIKPLLDQLMD